MKISEAKEAILELYKTESVTALISPRGVGKTSVYRQCAETLNIGYIDLYAAALEGPDFMGLPDKDKSDGVTRYLAPQFLPTIQSIEKGLYPASGILVLEEINRVNTDTISVLYPLLLDKTINGHKLGDGWRIGITMNPDSMNYLVNTLDDAMIDRFITLNIDPNLEDYIEYSRSTTFYEPVLNYLKSNPEMLLVEQTDSNAILKSPTPRGWSRVQDVLKSCNLGSSIRQEVIAGIVGPVAAASYVGFEESNLLDIPEPGKIISDYNSVNSSVLEIIQSLRFDIITNIINSISTVLTDDPHELQETNKFLNDLPVELQVLFYKELAISNPAIMELASDYFDSYEQVSDTVIEMMME